MSRIESLWKKLDEDNSFESGVVLKRYSSKSIQDYYAALIMPEKIKSIAIRIPSDIRVVSELVNDLRDIKIKSYPDNLHEDSKLLVISLVDDSLTEIFAVLCEDLFQKIRLIAVHKQLYDTLFERIQHWKELFQKSKNSSLTTEKQKGLYGELYFLNKIIEHTKNPIFCLDIWKGPEFGIRDFEYNKCAVEVKTSSTHNQQKLFINSARQLDTSTLDSIFVMHLSVEIQNRVKHTLSEIVKKIKSGINTNYQAVTLFKMKLLKAGYIESHTSIYDKTGYEIRFEKYYHVKDDFPRIEENEIRTGVGDVKYSIIPPSNDNYLVSFNEVIKSLGAPA